MLLLLLLLLLLLVVVVAAVVEDVVVDCSLAEEGEINPFISSGSSFRISKRFKKNAKFQGITFCF